MIVPYSPLRRPLRPGAGLFAVATAPPPSRPIVEYDGFGDLGDLGAAKKKKKGKSAKGHAGSLFSPGGTPAELWNRPWKKRKVDLSGVFSPEDTIIAVARGMHPGVQWGMEHRATIRGGLTALKMAGVKGYTKVNVDKLKSTTLNLPKHDKELIKAAGGGKNLKAAALRIQAIVHKHGLGKAAWGARQLYILENLKGFQIAHGVTAAAVNVIPAVGQIVSAAVAAHMAISAAIAKKVSEQAGKNLSEGLAEYKAKKAAAKGQTVSMSRTRPDAADDASTEDGAGTDTADETSADGAGSADAASAGGMTGALAGNRKWLLIGGALVAGVLVLVAATSGGRSSARRAA